jgi:hypothetical protein
MRNKCLNGLVFFVIISLSLVTCVKEPLYVFSEDPEEHRKDSISLILISKLNSDSIKSTAEWLQGMDTRFALADNRKQIAFKIRDRFKKIGYSDASVDSFWVSKTWRSQNYSLWQYNIMSELRGSLYPDSVMIIGAHFDDILSTGDPFSGAPGANDNASGVAAMIEIARVMKVMNYSPSISIQFVAFGAEELGLLGSADFASKLAFSGRPVKIMINNDMIACETNSDRLNWAVKIMYYKNAKDLSASAEKITVKYTDLTPHLDTMYYKYSDSYSFYLHGFKPVFFYSNSPDNNYHTINDLVANYNFDYCKEVASISCALLVYSE